MLYLTSFYTHDHNFDLIEFMMMFQYIIFFIATIKMLPHIINLFIRVNATSKRIEEVFALEDSIKEYDFLPENNSDKIIEFNNVSFKYGEKYIFRDLSFDIDKNSRVAIIGRVASGKSTIFSIISGLYQIEDGQVLIDDNDMSQLAQMCLQNKISFATQKSFAINDSLRANLVLGDDTITTDRILEASQVSLLDECYDNLEKDLDKKIYELGSNMSFNAKERLNITRCLLHEGSIYMFDNVLTSYDKTREYEIYENIKNFLKDKTLLFVTENIDILKDMDKIIVLDDNKIITGKHEDLMIKSEYYKLLCAAQQEDGDNDY